MKKVLSVVLMAVLCVCMLTACGGPLSGKYVSEATNMNYYDFQGGNKVVAQQMGVQMEGTYQVKDGIALMVFTTSVFGMESQTNYKLTILDDKTLVDTTFGVETRYTK